MVNYSNSTINDQISNRFLYPTTTTRSTNPYYYLPSFYYNHHEPSNHTAITDLKSSNAYINRSQNPESTKYILDKSSSVDIYAGPSADTINYTSISEENAHIDGGAGIDTLDLAQLTVEEALDALKNAGYSFILFPSGGFGLKLNEKVTRFESIERIAFGDQTFDFRFNDQLSLFLEAVDKKGIEIFDQHIMNEDPYYAFRNQSYRESNPNNYYRKINLTREPENLHYDFSSIDPNNGSIINTYRVNNFDSRQDRFHVYNVPPGVEIIFALESQDIAVYYKNIQTKEVSSLPIAILSGANQIA